MRFSLQREVLLKPLAQVVNVVERRHTLPVLANLLYHHHHITASAKDQAAEWALPRLPTRLRPVMAHARDLYRTTTYADEWWPGGLREQAPVLVRHVLCVLGFEHDGAADDARRT